MVGPQYPSYNRKNVTAFATLDGVSTATAAGEIYQPAASSPAQAHCENRLDFSQSHYARGVEWARTVSNRRPLVCNTLRPPQPLRTGAEINAVRTDIPNS